MMTEFREALAKARRTRDHHLPFRARSVIETSGGRQAPPELRGKTGAGGEEVDV